MFLSSICRKPLLAPICVSSPTSCSCQNALPKNIKKTQPPTNHTNKQQITTSNKPQTVNKPQTTTNNNTNPNPNQANQPNRIVPRPSTRAGRFADVPLATLASKGSNGQQPSASPELERPAGLQPWEQSSRAVCVMT